MQLKQVQMQTRMSRECLKSITLLYSAVNVCERVLMFSRKMSDSCLLESQY